MVGLLEVLDHATYFVPHGTLQFLLAVPIAMIPALRRDGAVGVSGKAIDMAISAGTASNALGKVMNGVTVDQVGASMFAKAALTVGVGSLAFFGASRSKLGMLSAFVVLQFAASGGWLIGCRVIHDGFPKSRWAACFAVLSSASRVASMACKISLGASLSFLDWRHICLLAALIGAFMLIVSAQLFHWATNYRGASFSPVTTTSNTDQRAQDALRDDASLRSDRPLVFVETESAMESDLSSLEDDSSRRTFFEEPLVEEKKASKLRRLLLDPGLLTYSFVMAGSTCVAAFDSMVPILLGDLTALSDSQISMSATVFPASLLLSVITYPLVIKRLDKKTTDSAPLFPRTRRRRQEAEQQEEEETGPLFTTVNTAEEEEEAPHYFFFFAKKVFTQATLQLELCLLTVSMVSALGLAFLAAKETRQSPLLVLPLVSGLAYGVGVTYYITPNVYALDFGGKDCATTSSILDTFGLVASSLWALVAAALQGVSRTTHQAWRLTMLLLAFILFLTALASVLGALFFDRLRRNKKKKETSPHSRGGHGASCDHRRQADAAYFLPSAHDPTARFLPPDHIHTITTNIDTTPSYSPPTR